MKITDVIVEQLRFELDPPFRAAWDPNPRAHFDASLVRVTTDEGITGIGSGDTMTGFESIRGMFIGEDPLAIARHVKVIESASFHGGRYWPLEAALWDILGKVTNQPVSVLFGNAADRVAAYASFGELKPPAERVAAAVQARAEGFRAAKIRIDHRRVNEGIAAVRAVREELGPDFQIMVDLNQSWRMAGDITPPADIADVRRTVARLRELDVFWVEEPLPYPDLDGFRQLRAENPGLRIAAGEMLQSVPDLVRCLEEDALDVYQMDAVLAVGMMRARTLAELAAVKHRGFTPHSWTNGIGLLANLHLCAGVGGGPYLEVPYDPPYWTPDRRDFMLARPLRVNAEGDLEVPCLPGLGVELDEEKIARWRIG